MRIIKTLLVSLITLLATATHAETIGVSMASLDPFLSVVANSLKDEAAKHPQIRLQLLDAGNSSEQQLAQVQQLIAAKVDALIVNIVDAETSTLFNQLAQQARIPLIYLNRQPSDIKNMPTGIVFVGSNELDSGTLQIREVCERMHGKSKLLLLTGPMTDVAARVRTEDIERGVSSPGCSRVKILDKQTANWSRAEARARMQTWLEAGLTFEAVIANNDEMALGAIEAMKAAGMDMKQVIVAGIDAIPDALQAMKAGDLDITVLQNADAQGREGLRTAMAMSHNIYVKSRIWVPFELVTPDNLSQYLP
jgi:ABC-type sugar transport system substrate-binding protein